MNAHISLDLGIAAASEFLYLILFRYDPSPLLEFFYNKLFLPTFSLHLIIRRD